MFEDYKSLVLGSYEKMKKEGSLSLGLSFPKPANIRTECVIACESRFLKTDEKILIAFFGQQDDADAYRQAIKRHDTDKFKPLCNFLKDGEISTAEKNIELLAWLMDFQPRPYKWGVDYQALRDSTEKEIGPGINSLSEPGKVEENILTIPDNLTDRPVSALVRQPLKQKKFTTVHVKWMASFFSASLVLVCGLIYFIPTEKCMYWKEDHYEPVSCNQKVGDSMV